MTHEQDEKAKLSVVGQPSRKMAEPPALLTNIINNSVDRASRLMEGMFAAADDLLYDLSKRASSNNEQNLYFEAMRETRIRRKGIINSFAQALKTNFEDIQHAHSQTHAQQTHAEQRSDDSGHDKDSAFSIVESDQLETQLAITNITSRGRETYNSELFELSARLSHVLSPTTINEDNNPLDPKQITQAFINSCEQNIKLNVKNQLILYKVFENHVIKQLGHIYSEANQSFIEAGILPKVPHSTQQTKQERESPVKVERQAFEDIETEIPTTDQTQATAFSNSETSDGTQALTFELDLNTLSYLMASARQTSDHGTDTGYKTFAENPGPQMNTSELANLLTDTQSLVDNQMVSLRPKNILTDVVEKLLSQESPTQAKSIERADEEMINLVAMFFDHLLEDENLPLATQTLICRLQIPILKVALKDKRFLVDTEHPCRKLLNTITEAGLFFDENRPLEKDQLYASMVKGVSEVNRNYDADNNLFIKVEMQIAELLDKEKRKSSVIERRTNQKEEGKSKIKFARATAQTTLYERMKNYSLPETITNFLVNTWLQVLIIILIKKGKESDEWVEAEQAVSDLIWLSQPHKDERSKQRKSRLERTLIHHLEVGLEMAIGSAQARMAQIAEIQKVLKQLDETHADNAASDQTIKKELNFQKLNESHKASLGKDQESKKNWEDMTALERQQANIQQVSNEFYLEAKNMREGTWFEYVEEESGKRLRCKLSAKINSEHYIFVNRLGFKTLEKTRREFAADLQTKKARHVDARPMFERIMQNVVGHVRRSNSKEVADVKI